MAMRTRPGPRCRVSPCRNGFEVDLPAVKTIGLGPRANRPRRPKGHIETWDATKSEYVSRGEFTTTPDAAAVLTFTPIETSRLRVVIDRLDSVAAAASIQTLDWRDKP